MILTSSLFWIFFWCALYWWAWLNLSSTAYIIAVHLHARLTNVGIQWIINNFFVSMCFLCYFYIQDQACTQSRQMILMLMFLWITWRTYFSVWFQWSELSFQIFLMILVFNNKGITLLYGIVLRNCLFIEHMHILALFI